MLALSAGGHHTLCALALFHTMFALCPGMGHNNIIVVEQNHTNQTNTCYQYMHSLLQRMTHDAIATLYSMFTSTQWGLFCPLAVGVYPDTKYHDKPPKTFWKSAAH